MIVSDKASAIASRAGRRLIGCFEGDFGRRQGNDGESMNIGMHHVMEAIIHQPVSAYPAFAFKNIGNQAQAVMSAAGSGSRMTCVEAGFVLQLALHRGKSCIEPLPD